MRILKAFAALAAALSLVAFASPQACSDAAYKAERNGALFSVEKEPGAPSEALEGVRADARLAGCEALSFAGPMSWRDWESLAYILSRYPGIKRLSVASSGSVGVDLASLRTPLIAQTVSESLLAFFEGGGEMSLRLENASDWESPGRPYSRLVDSLLAYGPRMRLALAHSSLAFRGGSAFSFASLSLGLSSRLYVSSANGEIGELTVDCGSEILSPFDSAHAARLLDLSKIGRLRWTTKARESLETAAQGREIALLRCSSSLTEPLASLIARSSPSGARSFEASGSLSPAVWGLIAASPGLERLRLSLSSDAPASCLRQMDGAGKALLSLEMDLGGGLFRTAPQIAQALQQSRPQLSFALKVSGGATAEVAGALRMDSLLLSRGTIQLGEPASVAAESFLAKGGKLENCVGFPAGTPMEEAALFLSSCQGPVSARIGGVPILESSFDSAVPDSSGGAFLAWTPAPLADGYVLERVSPAGERKAFFVGGQASSYYTDMGLEANTVYEYRIAATFSGRAGLMGETARVLTAPPPPSLSASARAHAEVNLGLAGSPGADGFEIYRAASPDGPWQYIAGAKGASYLDQSCEAGLSYWYRARAFRSKGGFRHYSPFSASAQADLRLPAPTGLRGAAAGDQVSLTWDEVEGADGYQIFTSQSRAEGYAFQKTASGLGCEIASGAAYYKVRCYKKLSGGQDLYSGFAEPISVGTPQ